MVKTKNKIIFIYLITSLLTSCEIGSTIDIDNSEVTEFSDVPNWSKEVIWYQVFVETFRNGDSDNDPTKLDIEGGYPGFVPSSWQITPWTHDWYKPDLYFAELEGKKDAEGHDINTFALKSQLRRYGGDLQGVLNKIDYLDSLGITAIYFNPLNDAPSNHKYDARNWRHIDRNFGPSPRRDIEIMQKETPDNPSTWKMTGADKLFLDVIAKLHKRGIRIIMDYSFNHTGSEFWAWKDLVKNQEKSKYVDWYWINKFDDPKTPENEFDYDGWFGVKSLVEIKETQYVNHKNSSRTFEGNFVSDDVKQHIFNVTKKWMDPNGDGDPSDGVDGFRLDVCAEVPMGFWREYRKVVRAINPEAYLVGETWFERFPVSMMDPKPLLKGDIFDGVMNYRWYKAAREFFIGANAIPASAFVDSLNRIAHNLSAQHNYAMMNIAASHDSPRLSTSLFNEENKYKFKVTPTLKDNYKINKPNKETFVTKKLLLVHQFTYIGAPHIWAGDEMGMWGAEMGDSRKPLIWQDYDFEPEKTHPLGKIRPTDNVKFNNIDFVMINNDKRGLAYSRYDEKNEALVAFNTSNIEQTFLLPIKMTGKYTDLLSDIKTKIRANKNIEITLPARSSAILINK
jgi:cyclomaltodextrinase